MCQRWTQVLLLLFWAASSAQAEELDFKEELDFNRDIRPILSNNCFLCHGPDPDSLEAGLRLDVRDSATTPLDSGETAIVPGDPDASELVARVSSEDESIRMPPADHGAPLSAKEIATLRAWVEQGAPYAAHWSYTKPIRTPPPAPPEELANWPRNPIDHFVLQRMSKHGLRPSPPADRYALARRVYLDLTGLPPTIQEVDAFVEDADPHAYEKLVDALLQRPAFGEHWARKWLDLARYADSAGYADDPPRTIWAYRDWVIRSMNENQPFDAFTIEQLAGDLLPDPSQQQLIATAFHRNTLTNNEGGTQDEEFRNVAIVDRVNTTMAVWMGTTMACAQCHTHKYDPISQDEYFQFFAIFNNTEDADRRDESPRIQIFTEEQKQLRQDLEQQVDRLKNSLATPTAALAKSQQAWEQRLRQAPDWRTLSPAEARRESGKPIELAGDAVLLSEATDKDVTTVTLPLEAGDSLSALRLEALPHPSLPGEGPGLSGGNFVVSSIEADLVPEGDSPPAAQYVRVTNRGKGQILSLAEVQVFSGGENVALQAKATQHSTDYAGPPELAIDGNTDGNFDNKSVTHTKTAEDPWWELALSAPVGIERVVIWNRTDNGLHTRLSDFSIELLDQDRHVVWSDRIKQPPHPSASYAPSNVRPLVFAAATADYQQPNFGPQHVLQNKAGGNNGWAIGGATGKPHSLVLTLNQKVEIKEPSRLRVRIAQQSPHAQHLLGHFRLGATDDSTAIERAELPAPLLAVIDGTDTSSEAREQLAQHYREQWAPELKEQREQLAAAEKRLASLKPATSVPILRERDNRRATHLQFRGNYLDKGKEVERGLPSAFTSALTTKAPAEQDAEQLDRLAVAQWLVSPQNPLTGRVLANRYWESIFGQGIVVTSEEFGSQGEPPTHPQLLDWLATELLENGWDRKALLKLLVTSATYRQSAKVTAESASLDPDNRWLARGPRVRLTAEMVRDQALFASGLLSDKMYGPPVRPPQPNLGLTAAFGSSTDWKTSQGEDRYRRGIYTTWRRSNPYPSMATFDAPNREVCTVRRNRTNTPLQSLVTLNDPVYVEAAQSLARRALQHEGTLEEQLARAFRRCLLRKPKLEEIQALRTLYDDSRKQLSGQEGEAKQLATDPLGELPAGLEPVEAAAMTVVCNVLLNLDEMFLKR